VIKHLPFPDISRDCVPIFATNFDVRVGDMVVKMYQVPASLAFALTEFKVQGWTYTRAVLDQSPVKGDNNHQRYCSCNVQFSRLRSAEGLGLLQPLTLRDIRWQIHPDLRSENQRLQQLAAVTMRLEMDKLAVDLGGPRT
jgi:hypothetical protein